MNPAERHLGIRRTYVCPDNVVSNAKLIARGGVAIDLREHQTPRPKRGRVRIERRKSRRDQVGVDEEAGIPASNGRNSRAKVVFPAPFGPAMITIFFSALILTILADRASL